MSDHDHAFKELLGFFPEFIDLFFPQVAAYLDRHSLEFQPQELFADLTEGDTEDETARATASEARVLEADGTATTKCGTGTADIGFCGHLFEVRSSGRRGVSAGA